MAQGAADIPSPATNVGGRRICLEIAGITTALVCSDPEMKLELESVMNLFRVEGGDADVTVQASWGDLPEECAGEMVFDSGGLWRLYGERGELTFQFISPLFGERPYKIATFAADFRSCRVLLQRAFFNPDNPVYPLEYPLDELLMVNLLALGRGVEIHACGVADSAGKGRLFAGQSGAGKTTMAKLWEQVDGAQILSDDRIILREAQGRIWMYGTPWHGEAGFAVPAGVPLEELFFLHHGSENALERMTGVEAAAFLFARSFPPFYSSSGIGYTLEFLERVVQAVPCYDLRSVPDQRVVDYIRTHAESTGSRP